MRFLLNVYPNAAEGHEDFLAAAGQAGELISAHTFADPTLSTVVKVRGGVVEVSEGPYLQDQASGQYVIDCESRERAVELAALVSSGGDVEIRPLMDTAGMEM